MPLVAVYGSLREGLHNHPLMGDSEFLGQVEVKGFDMYSAEGFPVILPEEPVKGMNAIIKADVYRVTEERLTGPLDRLEGHPTWYKRELIDTEFGKTWIYVMQDERYRDNQYVELGDWKEFYLGNSNTRLV